MENDKLTLDDDFFEISGDPMAAVEICFCAMTHIAVALEPTAVLEHPSVRILAAHISSLSAPADGSLGRRGSRRGRNMRPKFAPNTPSATKSVQARLSRPQERFWFLSNLDLEALTYNTPAYFRLHGSLDRKALAAAYGRCCVGMQC
jgi:hypothetical protein